jgi:hypothetical protein
MPCILVLITSRGYRTEVEKAPASMAEKASVSTFVAASSSEEDMMDGEGHLLKAWLFWVLNGGNN